MGVLQPGDEDLHYSDGSHRWFPPDPKVDEQAWRTRVEAHMERHRTSGGGSMPRRRGLR